MALSHLSTSEILANVGMATGTATSTTADTAILAAQGATRAIIVGSVSVTNRSATDTEVDIKDGTTTKDTISAPANGGAVKRYLWGWPCTANAALNFATKDSVDSVVVTAEYRIDAAAS